MKKIKYRYLSCEINQGTEEKPSIRQVFIMKDMDYSEKAEAVAKEEAYKGEYEIYDDGVEESTEPTPEERIAELEEALALLLSGVTE